MLERVGRSHTSVSRAAWGTSSLEAFEHQGYAWQGARQNPRTNSAALEVQGEKNLDKEGGVPWEGFAGLS
jgi:hypothetical protein